MICGKPFIAIRDSESKRNTMTKLILVRHGQSLANADRLFAGHSDFDLSEFGKEQASMAAHYLHKRERIHAIYASDLLRAHNTAVPFAKIYGLDITDAKELREIYAGKWESLSFDQIAETCPKDFNDWMNDFSNARCTEGESVAELYERVKSYVCKIAEENDGKTILIATHATPVRAINCFAMGYGADRMADVSFCGNAALNLFIYENGKIKIEQSNINEYLGELATEVPEKIRA